MSGLTDAEREARKFGTDSPHKPTDEFVRRAFAEGARHLWPDSRDPGWIVTFDRWLAAREQAAAAQVRDRMLALVDSWPTGDNGQDYRAAVTQCAIAVRSLATRLALDAAPPQPGDQVVSGLGDAYGTELDRRLAAERALMAVMQVVEEYESCGPKRQSTRDVLAAVRAATDGGRK